jgi:hypothetical protein
MHNIAPSSSRNDVLQAEEHDQSNEDIMGEDDGTNKVKGPMEKDDGTNQMIQDLFAWSDEDGDGYGIYDEPLLEKATKRIYEGSRENVISATLLLMNLKVMNHLSNTCMTQILRYVICFISYT